MGRPRVIDRERLIDLAEEIVSSSGASALSFGTLAATAKLPKASVQSVFGTREALIDAMLERWLQAETARYQTIAGDAPTPQRRAQAHIETLGTESEESVRRVASLMTALAGSDAQSETVTEWYGSRSNELEAFDDEERRLRIAFLAAEGAFFIRHIVRYEMSNALWDQIFDDLRSFVKS